MIMFISTKIKQIKNNLNAKIIKDVELSFDHVLNRTFLNDFVKNEQRRRWKTKESLFFTSNNSKKNESKNNQKLNKQQKNEN